MIRLQAVIENKGVQLDPEVVSELVRLALTDLSIEVRSINAVAVAD